MKREFDEILLVRISYIETMFFTWYTILQLETNTLLLYYQRSFIRNLIPIYRNIGGW